MSSNQTTLSPTRPPIVAEALVRHFGSGDDLVRAVDGVDLQVEAGEIFGFLGPNGAGKSTTVRMLTTLLRPTSGKATVAGFDVVQQADQVRRSIGVALQDAAIDPLMTGAELLQLQAVLYGLPKAIHKARAGELLERVGLTGAADRRVGTYSGGMRRRLDLAMSLIHQPSVLFLDEPTTGLDPMSRISLWEEIRRLNIEGTTVLLTTQYLEEADQLADRIAIIDHGLIVRQGEPAALKRELGDPTLFVHVAPEHIEAAKQLIAEFGELRPSPDGTLGVSVAGGSRSVSAVVRRLDEAGIAVDSLDLREPSLDDVFAQATGYRLEGAEAGSGESNFPEADAELRSGDRRGQADSWATAGPPMSIAALASDRRTAILAQTSAMSKRAILALARQPATVIPSLVFPLFFVALGTAAFGRAIELPNFPEVDSFLDFALAGAIVQGVLFGSITSATALAIDIETGFFDRLLASPTSRVSILVSRLAGAMVYARGADGVVRRRAAAVRPVGERRSGGGVGDDCRRDVDGARRRGCDVGDGDPHRIVGSGAGLVPAALHPAVPLECVLPSRDHERRLQAHRRHQPDLASRRGVP